MRRQRPDRRHDREPKPASGGLAPRRAAVALIVAVVRDRALMSDALARLPPELDAAERARAQRLATETLRGLATADRLLRPHLARSPAPEVRALLRLGVTELGHGAAPHGVVNDLVELAARGKRTATAKGLVNAVLRKLAPDAQARWLAAPPPRLPPWLRRPLLAAWGGNAVTRDRAGAGGGAAARPDGAGRSRGPRGTPGRAADADRLGAAGRDRTGHRAARL